ncbi:MAG TPA: hypothetical protein VLS51_10830 [Propionibacteriaceae bacterium]|nr:hypothetical protein [Propionibacteriaceae bacterium]
MTLTPLARSRAAARKPGRLGRWLPPSADAIAWVAMVALAAVCAGSPTERDPYWEARAGIENLTGTPLARPDAWSWSPVDRLFYPNSPLWNSLLGLSWWGGGFWGLFLFAFTAILTLFALSYLLARRLGAHPLAALAGLLFAFAWAMPMVSSRATIGVQILFTTGICLAMWWRARIPRHSALVNGLWVGAASTAIGVLGNWVHLSFFSLGPLLGAACGVYWMVSDWSDSWRARVRDARRWALVVATELGMVIGSLSTPYGVAGTLARSRETALSSSTAILEWVSPFHPGILERWPLMLRWSVAGVVAAVTVVCFVVWLTRTLRRGNLDNRRAAIIAIGCLAVPFAVAGEIWLRFLGVFTLLFIPVWGVAITWVAHRARARADRLPDGSPFHETAHRWTRTGPWRTVLTIVCGLLLPFAVWMGPVAHAVPPELQAIRALPSGCRLFSTAAIAAPAILTRPDVKVWYDGRADYYGLARLTDSETYFTGLSATAAPPGATCAILPALTQKDGLPLVTARMRADSSWRFVGTYNGFDLWLR